MNEDVCRDNKNCTFSNKFKELWLKLKFLCHSHWPFSLLWTQGIALKNIYAEVRLSAVPTKLLHTSSREEKGTTKMSLSLIIFLSTLYFYTHFFKGWWGWQPIQWLSYWDLICLSMCFHISWGSKQQQGCNFKLENKQLCKCSRMRHQSFPTSCMNK